MDEKEKKPNLLELFQGMLDDHLGKEEFVKSFENVVKTVKQFEERTTQDVQALTRTLTTMAEDMRRDSSMTLEEMKAQVNDLFVGEQLQRMRGDVDTMLSAVDERMALVRDGAPGPQGPAGPRGPQGPAGSPDTPAGIRDKLETLKGNERLDMSAIKGLLEELKRIEELRSHNYGGGGTSTIGVGAALGRIEVIEEEVTFAGTTGTLSNKPEPDSVKLYRGGVRLQEGTGKDYTVSGKTITLAVAAITGELFVADYRRS